MSKPKKKINPAAAVPQAPLALRAGTKVRAGGPPAETPDKQQADEGDGDDDDEEEDDEDGDEDALATHEPLRADAEAKHLAAAEAYKACKGTDSAAALMAAEEAGDAAMDAHGAAKASSMKLRGAEEQDPDSKPMAPPPAPGAALALVTLGGSSAASQLSIAAKAKAFEDIAAIFGTKGEAATILRAQAAHTAFGEVTKIKAEQKATAAASDLSKRTARLAAAVQAGMPRAQAFHVDANDKPSAPLGPWMRGSLAELDETLTALGYPAEAKPKVAALISSGGADEAGLEARARASGMSVEDRRAAEANQARCAAQDVTRSPR